MSGEIKLHETGERELAYLAYRQVLENIYNHPFVTEESRRLRHLLLSSVLPPEGQVYRPNSYHDPLTDELIVADPYFPVPFIFGGVARGQASVGSDIDYIVMHESDDYMNSHLAVPPVRNRKLITSRDSVHIYQDMVDGVYPSLETFVFCPAVGEFPGDDYNEIIAQSAYKLRQKVIKAINTTHLPYQTKSAEYVWGVMQARLSTLLLPNISNRLIGNSLDSSGLVFKDRQARLVAFRQEIERSYTKAAVARFFDSYDKLEFPNWETMKLAFAVE